MKNARDVLRLSLFIVGILFQFTSFFISRVEQVPWMMWPISPTYMRAQTGVRTLDCGKPLNPGDTGFLDIQNIVMKWLKQENPPEALAGMWIMGFDFVPRSIMNAGVTTIFEVKEFRIFLSSGRDLKLDSARLRNELEAMRKSSVFYSSLTFLIVGIAVVQIPLFFIRPTPRVTDRSKDHAKRELGTGTHHGQEYSVTVPGNPEDTTGDHPLVEEATVPEKMPDAEDANGENTGSNVSE